MVAARRPRQPTLIAARVTPDQHAHALANAEARGTTISDAVRSLLADAGYFDPPAPTTTPPEPT